MTSSTPFTCRYAEQNTVCCLNSSDSVRSGPASKLYVPQHSYVANLPWRALQQIHQFAIPRTAAKHCTLYVMPDMFVAGRVSFLPKQATPAVFQMAC